ncbi:MAG: molybdopterin-binding protein [Hydrotalea sp.]|nr:molybdopterin-binding protein [Hydrotalea sp.]
MPRDDSRPFIPLAITLVTLSDTRDMANDKSGAVLAEMVLAAGHKIHARHLLKDEAKDIVDCLEKIRQGEESKVVILTGGTGITARDITPEALQAFSQKHQGKEIVGFGELFRQLSYEKIGTSTIQSRAIGFVAGGLLLFALPGSPGAVKDAWQMILLSQLDNRHRPCNFVELLPRI